MLAIGSDCYSISNGQCCGNGISWTQNEFQEAIDGPVSSNLFDDEGIADIESLLSSVLETEFEQEELERILEDSDQIESWRVGEAIAEVYLTEHRSCLFPWPDSRDVRKDGSSLPGADLVGIGSDDVGSRFSFGEVKTSREEKYPPGAMYGRTGLKKQLEDLRDNEAIRKRLMKYLGFRAVNSSWRHQYQVASKRFIANTSDVQLFGVLIRDVSPHQDDVRARVERMSDGCPNGTSVELLALYIPRGEIAGLVDKATAASARMSS